MVITKKEVEEILEYEITDSQLKEAAKYAKNKQKYIYGLDPRPVVMQHWYLVRLTAEYIKNLAFSKFTMDLCNMINDMEKERLVKDQSAHTVAIL